MPTIYCANINRRVPATEGENVLEALEREGVDVYRWPGQYFPWHDSSFIDVVEGMENLSVPNGRERHRLKHRCPTYRLASEAHVYGDVVIKTQPCESALQDNG